MINNLTCSIHTQRNVTIYTIYHNFSARVSVLPFINMVAQVSDPNCVSNLPILKVLCFRYLLVTHGYLMFNISQLKEKQ